jgi:SAM-dependent methyltransferase
MYAALKDRLAAEDGLSRRCLAISESRRLADVLGLKATAFVDAAYPEHTLLALKFDAAAFDFCVSDQVLEHVEGDPFDAMRESFRVVRPGGFVVHTTCLLNPIHREPGDFWRFTPDALRLLCKSAGAVDIETGSWGNRQALAIAMAGARMVKVPLDASHPLHRIATANEPDWPIHSWVVARKPG